MPGAKLHVANLKIQWNWLFRNMDIKLEKLVDRWIEGLDKTFSITFVHMSGCKRNNQWLYWQRLSFYNFFSLQSKLLQSLFTSLLISVLTFRHFLWWSFVKISHSIHSYSLISIFLNNQFRWIFKVCDKSFCTRQGSNMSGDLQNQRMILISSRNLAKT